RSAPGPLRLASSAFCLFLEVGGGSRSSPCVSGGYPRRSRAISRPAVVSPCVSPSLLSTERGRSLMVSQRTANSPPSPHALCQARAGHTLHARAPRARGGQTRAVGKESFRGRTGETLRCEALRPPRVSSQTRAREENQGAFFLTRLTGETGRKTTPGEGG
ncbi:hypothetical protein TGPRC2_427730, partial [Toxoplasma gondii TgCatPRC2]